MKSSDTQKKEIQKKQATAFLRYARIAPRKMRLVAHIIKGMRVNEAEAQLIVHTRRPSDPLLKLLRSAIDNAKKNGLDIAKTVVSEIRVDNGPMLKRFMPRAQGRATPIHKISSHVTLVLQENESVVSSSRFVASKKEKKSAHKHEHEKGERVKQQKEQDKKDTKKEKETEPRVKEVKGAERALTPKMFRRKSI